MKFKIGDRLLDTIFKPQHEYQIVDAWKNIFDEYVYQLQDCKRPEIQIKELEKYLLKDYKVLE